MIPAVPGGSASSIFSPIPAATRLRATLPTIPPAAAPTTVAASNGGANRPTTRPTPPPAFAPHVVARLLHGDLTVGVLGHEHDAVGRDRPLADELHEAVVILLRELGD